MRNTTDRAARRGQDRSSAQGSARGSAPVRGTGAGGRNERVRPPGAPAPVIASTTVFAALAARRRASAIARCVYAGTIAASLGLGSLAVIVIALWISSPYADSGPGDALRSAAGLWLLAHGADLVRPDTLSGVPAPLGLTPLLLVPLVVWPLYRAARDAVDTAGEVRSALWGVAGGYVLVAGAVMLFAAGGPLPAEPWSAALHVSVLTVVSAAAGVWSAYGRPRGPLPWGSGPRGAAVREWGEAGVRAGLAAALVLVAGGALLVAVSLVRNAAALQESFGGLSGVWSGRFAVLLLALALVPNAAVWGAAYALGPGFSLGVGRSVGPLAAAPDTLLPSFPLLTAVPGSQGAALFWATCAVPLTAGLTLAWFTARAAKGTGGPKTAEEAHGGGDSGGEGPWSVRATALVAGAGALLCGLVCALLGEVAGGPLGSAALADFGPVWWQTGIAAFTWTAVTGVPGALGLRGLHVARLKWRLRREAAAAGASTGANPTEAGPADSTAGSPVAAVPAAARSALGASRTWIARIRGTRTPRDPESTSPPAVDALPAPSAPEPAPAWHSRLRTALHLPSRRPRRSTPTTDGPSAAPTTAAATTTANEEVPAEAAETATTGAPRRWWPFRRSASRHLPPADTFEPYDFLPPDAPTRDPLATAPASPAPTPLPPEADPTTSATAGTDGEPADRP
ncbi:hypothetical protein DSC45_01475 [Streptomyces sp. YIM 130001]|uniref:cell division protein PerM n=1 Tax=Streptomyces sp. YIM 130001 TaxID=2259644 RepID=UPI000EE667E7|nr:DUF6350 family protein [Streptomyces sp. YIM 130001]RII21061.1 hypothetical protein DSC45_01475 [Streptomyces sp. YIM 130001]